MTYDKIYRAFLAKMLEDEWAEWTWEEVEQDLRELLEAAIAWFKFPKTSMERDENGFLNELSNQEIQILATYMKVEWYNRTILTWENIKPLYIERDFSQANLLSKFNETLANEKINAQRLERMYYRSADHKPFDFTKLAGSK